MDNVRLSDIVRSSRLAATDWQPNAYAFLAMVAHELSQPISAIVAALAMMERRVHQQIGERARAIAARQVDHLRRILDDLLDAARVQRGRFDLQRVPVDLVRLVSDCVEVIRVRAEERQQHVAYLASEPSLWVTGDPHRLRQIASNLLDNAIKYTPAAGTIEVAVCAHQRWIEIRVRDSGCGIAPEHLTHIFELFVHEPSSGAGGLGIGLSVVKRLTEAHGGTVHARSHGLGLGSTFTVRLPVCNEPHEQRDLKNDDMDVELTEDAATIRGGAPRGEAIRRHASEAPMSRKNVTIHTLFVIIVVLSMALVCASKRAEAAAGTDHESSSIAATNKSDD